MLKRHHQFGTRSFATALGAVFAGSVLAQVQAETITVNIASDTIDVDWQTATIADLPGPDGDISFSEALIAANNTPGHDTIHFAIPESEWTLQFLFPGRAVLQTSTGFFFRAFDEVTIDGMSQTAFTGDTNPDGAEVAIFGAELFLNADNCTLLGFDSSAVSVNGSNSLVENCTGTMNISLFGGSGSIIRHNTGGTIKIDRSNNNIVTGNTVTRVRVLGWVGGGQPATNNRIGGPTLEDRNYITGFGTWNGEGFPGGTTVQIFDALDTLIENNWIGTTPDGMDQGSLASVVGVGLEGENHNTVIRNNRIAGILGHGQGPHAAGLLFGSAIRVYGKGSGVTIAGNTVGLNANDEPVLGSVVGITADNYFEGPVSDVVVGGPKGAGNVIAGHLLSGVVINNTFPAVRLSENSIHNNGALGIDLITQSFATGVTANDVLDADSGGNGLQNYPVVDSAVRVGATVQVTGSIDTTAMTSCTLEFFASPVCDESGHGEGQMFVGSTSLITDASGHASFDEVFALSVPGGWFMTATATREPIGATSEFSACTVIETENSMPGDINSDGEITAEDRTTFCAVIGSQSGDPEFVAAADLNDDGVIDQVDLALLNDIMPPCGADVVSSKTFAPPADGVTNGADLAFLLGAWGNGASCADFVSSGTFAPPPDGVVDGADLAYLLGAWGGC